MTTYTDNQLKQALAKMLPECLNMMNNEVRGECLAWNGNYPLPVLDTELLCLCRDAEMSLSVKEYSKFELNLESIVIDQSDTKDWRDTSASWQQRVIALAKVKNIKI